MRVIFSGSRFWDDEKPVLEALNKLIRKISKEKIVIISGGAPGLDSLVESISKSLGLKTEVFFADWDLHKKAAGPIRNKRMLESGANLVIAFPLGESKGTRNMIKIAVDNHVKTLIYENNQWTLIQPTNIR